MGLEHRRKIGEANRGEKHGLWKGDTVGYASLHEWIERNFGKAKIYSCMHCGGLRKSSRIEWANLTNIYNRDLQNWTTLCSSCHKSYDRIVENITKHKN